MLWNESMEVMLDFKQQHMGMTKRIMFYNYEGMISDPGDLKIIHHWASWTAEQKRKY